MSEAANLVFQWIFVLNSVKNKFFPVSIVNFYFIFTIITTIAGFFKYKLKVKKELRNAWTYFRGGLYTAGLFLGFYGMHLVVLKALVWKRLVFCNIAESDGLKGTVQKLKTKQPFPKTSLGILITIIMRVDFY